MDLVEYITYKGEQLPVRVTNYALIRTNRDHMKCPEWDIHDVAETMLWYSLQAGFEAIGKECTIKRETIPFIYDMCSKEFDEAIKYFNPEAAKIAEEEALESDKKK
jgi:hypothetical protein